MDTKVYKNIYRLLKLVLLVVIITGFQKHPNAQNYALTFDGSGDYVNFGSPPGLQITGDQTIEMWVYPYALDARRNPMAKAYGGEGTMTLELDGTVSYFYGTNGGNGNPYMAINTLGTINANEWTHIAIVRDLNAMKLNWYINGVQVNSTTAEFTYAQAGTNPFYIARGYVSDFKGMIDEVRVWNVARTASQIAATANVSLPGSVSGLAAVWNFNEGSGATVIDQTSNGNDGTIVGNTSFVVSEVPVYPYTPGNEPFEPVPPTGLPYNIVLSDILINGLAPPLGTQIAVFDGELCVGDGYYIGDESLNLVAWEADPDQNLAGFTAGNTMTFKFHTVWHSEHKNFDAGATYSRGDGTFGFSPFTVAGLSASTLLIPDFSISADVVNFNTVVVNQSKTMPLVIENNGSAILNVNSIQNSDNHFTTSDNGLLIDPASKDTLWVTFVPTEVTAYSDVLTMNTDDPDVPSLEIPLYGTGLPEQTPQISVSPSALNFGGIAMNTSTSELLNIYNAGNGTLNVTGITSSNAAFSIAGNTSFSLEQGENANVEVVFAPTESGVFSGQLTISNNDQQLLVPAFGIASQGHFTSVEPTGKPYSIIVEDINIDGFRPKVGDEVVVFDGELCVGTGIANPEGNSLSLDGSGDYLINDNSTTFDLQHLSISAWVYSGNFSQNGFIFEKGPVNSQYSLFFEGASLNFRTYSAGASGYDNFYNNSAGLGISNNAWHLITATYDGNQKKIYVDGKLKASQDYNKLLRTGQQGQIIGAYGGTGSHSYYFNGYIDEVRIWDYARTEEEIQKDMFRELDSNEQGLTGYWNFDDGNFNNLVPGATNSSLSGNANINGGQNLEILSNILITAWEKDDGLGLPGFTPGNPMSFKVWTEIYDNWVEVDATPDYIVGDGNFGFGQFSVLSLEGTTGLEPDIHVPVDNIYVGQVTVGESVVNELTVHNTGNAPLHITVSENSDAFTASIATEVVPEMDSITFEITFTPAAPGGYSAVLSIESNDPDEDIITVGLEGFALPAGSTDIATSVDHLNIGDVVVNTGGTASFFVINTGTAALQVTGISGNNAVFSATPASFTLENTNDLMEVFVSFTPDAKGLFTDALSISSNAADHSVSVSGIGFEDHFALVEPTGKPYHIIIENTNLESHIVPGDEITVFDGELAVGMASLIDLQNISITAWEKDDENGLPGFTPGNEMSFKIWTEINGIDSELDATPTYAIGDGTFGFGQFTVVDLEFGLPEIHVDPEEFFVALEEPDSTERILTISNNGDANLSFDIIKSNGIYGNSVNLDGSGDYVNTGNWTVGTQWTVEAWVNPSSTPAGRKGIMGGFNSCLDWGIAMSSGEFGVSIKPPGECSQTVYSGFTPTVGKWYHVAGTCDGTTASIYVNGQLMNSGPVQTNYSGVNTSIRIGGESCCSSNNFPGLVDEVRVWNNALSEAEIQSNMNRILTGGETGMVGYWNFDDGTANDLSGNGHNGSFVGNAALIASNAPTDDFIEVLNGSGTVSPSGSTDVTIKVRSEGLNDGLYETTLEVNNNTVNQSPVLVPLTLNVTGSPQIAANVDSLGVGKVVVGESSENTLTITNIGTKELVVDDALVVDGANTGFSYSYPAKDFPASIAPGESIEVNVIFSPMLPGMVSDTLRFASNAGSAPIFDVLLTGEGITPPEIFVSQTSFSHTFPCSDVYNDSIKVYNIGQEDLEIELAGSMPWLAANPSQATIAGGDSATIMVSISTLELFVGLHQAELIITTNDPDHPTVEVDYFITVTGDPAILCSDFFDFGTGNVGESIVGELTVANSGCDTLEILSVSIQSQYQVFFVENPMFTVPPGSASQLLITFMPESTQQYSGIVTINSNDEANPAYAVVLAATGVEPPEMVVSPLNIASTLQSGDSEQKSFSVQNTGGEVLNFSTDVSPLNRYMLYLDGNGDYVNVVHADHLNPGTAITLEAWIFLLDNTNEFIMGKENSSEGNYRLFVNANHQFEFSLNGTHNLTSNAQAVKNQWIHIAAAFDGETMQIFVDGLLDIEESFEAFSIQPNTDNLRIGRSFQYAYFNGVMDEVRIWDIARNQSEVQSTMSQALSGNEPELLLYFPFVNPTGNIISDASTYSQDGITYGNPQRQSSSVPFDDYMTVNNGSGNLTANQLQNVVLSLNSQGFLAGDYQREIIVNGNATGNPSDTVSLSLSIEGLGKIAANPMQLQFDDTFLGLKDTVELIIENTGALAANVSGMQFSSPVFSSLNEITKIFPFSQKTLTLVFEPGAVQQYNETLTILLENAEQTQLQIPLTGLGVTPPIPVFTPDMAAFGDVVVNNTGTVGISLTNEGSSLLEIFDFNFSDDTFFATDLQLPLTLAFQEETFFDVFFSPFNYDMISEELILTTNVGLVSFTLSGTGVPPDHDLSIVDVLAPMDGCGLSNSELLTVVVHNFGELQQSNFDVGYSINGGPSVEETVAATLESGESLQYSFTQTLNLVSLGTYDLDIFTLLGNDQNTWNDTTHYTVVNSPSVGEFSQMVPADSSFGVVDPVNFSWTAVVNADVYDLYLWRTNQQKPTNPTVAGITATTYTYVEYLNKNYLYNWQLVARNQCSQSESEINVFSFNVFSDLTVDEIIIPETGNSGETKDISFTIKNIGTGSTGIVPWKDKVYISSSPVFDVQTAVLLTTVSNLSALPSGLSYTNTVSITLANYLEGAQYIFVKTDANNIIQETNEENNLVVSDGPIIVSLPPYPDLSVGGVESISGNIVPGGTVSIGWSVENVGDADAIGGWSQRAAIVKGTQRLILGYLQYNDTLDAMGIISQTASFNVPKYPGLDGDIKLEVKLTPNPGLVEKPNGAANNTAISVENVLVEKVLFITMPSPTLNENAVNPLFCNVYRSGNRDEELIVNLDVSEDDRITMPQTVAIPVNQSGVSFTVSAIDNDLIEGDIDLVIGAQAVDYFSTAVGLLIVEDEMPSLFLNINLDEANEGDKIDVTLSRDLVTDEALAVNVVTNISSQLALPPAITIPANESFVTVEVDVVDDNVPELTKDVIVSASKAGYIPGRDTITLIDDDLQAIELILNPDTISEAGGPYASWGTIILPEPADGQLVIQLSANPLGQLFFPQQVTIPNGQMEAQFNIGAVDNGVLDGDRVVDFTAAVYLASCGCGAPPESGGAVTLEITIIDNDGPSLSVVSDPFVVNENLVNAGVLTITRNTLGGDEIEVTLQHNRPDEIELQPTAIIPEGEDVVEVPFNTLDDGIEDGDQIVSVTVSSDGYSNGTCWVMVSDRNQPDYQLAGMSLSQNSILINDLVTVDIQIANNGFALAPQGAKVEIFKSTDNVLDDNDALLASLTTPDVISIGDTLQMQHSVTLTGDVGDYYLFATVNKDGFFNELVGINNTSQPQLLSVAPDYNAVVTVDGDVFNGTSAITINGVTETVAKDPAPDKPVDIYIMVNGVRRVYPVISDENGEFSMDFIPLNGEAGNYAVGACYPNQGLDEVQDEFVLLGAKHTATGYIIWELYLGETQQKFIEIKNFSSLPLTDLDIEVISSPPGCNFNAVSLASLAGNSYATMSYSVDATDVTAGNQYEEVKLRLTSAEGTKFNFSAWFYCSATMGNLKLNPVVLNESMVKDQVNYVEFEVLNNGLDETGLISIELPDLNWMSLASPDTISSLMPGETAAVTLRLIPGDDLQLNNPITGVLALSGTNSNSVGLPFSFEPISEETGDLLVDVVDEYTYNTAAAPHLDSAMVIITHPYTGQIIAQGITDANGHFLVEDINEGFYTLKVQAPQHAGYQDYVYIEKGVLNTELIFIAFQAITYSWEVVPTLIEDEYEITLITVFETNVPAPVVIMNMPDTMPHLEQGEYFPFILTMTNEGLITAEDVEVTFPEDDEYMFTANVDQVDIFPQTAIQIPVIMERRPEGQSASSGRAAPCIDYVVASYKFECGPDGQLRLVRDDVYYRGRYCPGGGNPGGGGFPWWGGGGYGPGGPGWGGCCGYVGPTVGPTTPYQSTNAGCDPCIETMANALWSCTPIPNIGIGAGKQSGDRGWGSVAWGAFKFVKGLWKKVKCAWNIGWAIGTCINEYIINGPTFPDNGAPEEMIQAQEDLFMCDKGFVAIENIVIETYRDEDLLAKQDFLIFNDSTLYHIENEIPIDDERKNELLMIFSDSDIFESEILEFVDHWNTTMEAWDSGIFSPTPEYPGIIELDLLNDYVLTLDTAINYAYSRGYPTLDSLYNASYAIAQGYTEETSTAVCATVTVQFSQTLTMTREAFEGTLSIFNGHDTDAMENILVDLEVRDEEGILRNDLFQINTESLDQITGIDGTGILNAQVDGTAVIIFIPERGAAPDVPVYYSFGGTLSYLDPFTGEMFEQPLFPVTLQVNPSPNLYLNYFMQRDIFGDDALTLDKVEPMIPAELAVMIDNQGVGTAMSVNLESAQPEIIENEKGLLIDFEIIGSNLSGEPTQLGLYNIDFGDIPGGEIAVGQWWFTSTLLGHFISYEASVNHLDSYGNPDLSLVSGIEIHELIKSVSVYGPLDDTINDFLVNDIPDTEDIPDAIYLSNGAIAQVLLAASSETDGPVTLNDTVVQLTVEPSSVDGWNYTKLDDPGNGLYEIVSCTRNEDGQEIPLENIWLTYSTIPDGGEPIYENKLHFVDEFSEMSTQTYTVVFAPIDQDVPEVVAINGIPEEPIDTPLESVEVVFSEPIEPTTFTYEDMTLKNQAGPNLMDTLVTVSQVNDSTFNVDISAKTAPNGYYTLTVQAAGVADLVGNYGNYGVQVGWLQAIATPAIDYFFGLPEVPSGPIDTLLVLFNMPINEETFTTDQIILTNPDGDPVSTESLVITSESFNSVLFKISGLEPFNTEDGTYELTFKLTEIQGETGQVGIQDQSVEWTVCQIDLPTADAGDDASICVGEMLQLDGAVENAASFVWASSGTGSFNDDQLLTATYTPSPADIAAGSVEISLTAEPLGECAVSVTSSFTLSIQSEPLAIAGGDAEICEDQTHQLFGAVMNSDNFFWSTGGDGSFDNAQGLTAIYTPGAGDILSGSAELMLTAEAISPCVLSSESQLLLTVKAGPFADAGDEAIVCEYEPHKLSGAVENAESFVWSSGGDGSFDFPDVLDPVYTQGPQDIINGYVDLNLFAQPINPCYFAKTSTVRITLQYLPVADIGGDITVCEGESAYLDAIVENEENLLWVANGDGSFSSPFITNPVYTPGPDDIASGSVNVILFARPIVPCYYSDVATMTIYIQSLVSADAGVDGVSCEGQPYQLFGTVENASLVLWTTEGDGIFDDPGLISPVYTLGENDILAEQVVLTISAEAISPCTIAATDQMTLVVNNCHEVIIPMGWSGLSSYVEPQDANPETMFGNILNDLVILQSLTGVYWPGQNLNTMGLWNRHEGYSIKVTKEVSLTIGGSRSTDNNQSLSEGWNLIPVLSSCDVDVETLFEGLDVVIVKEVAGWNVYWPELNINNLNDVRSGKSYFVLMNSAAEIIFPDCTKSSSSGSANYSPDMNELIRSTPWNSFSQTPSTHIIGLPVEAIDPSVLKPGDMLGAFDQNGYCFGLTLWEDESTSITVFGDDQLTTEKDGFAEDDDIYFRVYAMANEQVSELDVEWNVNFPDADGLFSTNGLSAIQSLKLGATQINQPGSFDALIYPNPASDKVNIDLEKQQEVSVIFYDIHGQEVLQQKLYNLRNQLDISHLRSGVYLIKLEGEEIMKVERLVKK